jgi:hypothetical protein
LRELVGATQEAGALLGRAMKNLRLSARAHDRILKVARTIADLDCASRVAAPHVHEALQYRALDRPLEPGSQGPALPPLPTAHAGAPPPGPLGVRELEEG